MLPEKNAMNDDDCNTEVYTRTCVAYMYAHTRTQV